MTKKSSSSIEIRCESPSHKRPAPFEEFWFGAAYYPEHWDAATRARDPERMAKAGFNLIRLAEFAWALMEPKQGRYDFSIFEETISRLAEQGIKTILCTPTAAPPRWLTRRHPEILRVNADGVPLAHGSRQHACHASSEFRKHSRRITQAMAKHFQGNPYVIGWQTDNEFHCHFAECHCASCQVAFREFLRGKFGDDISALNRAWGSIFWSGTYSDFEDIETPRHAKPTYANPAHLLDYHRYLSWAVTRFQREQVEILRKANAAWWIMHNGFFQHLDYRGEFSRDLDLMGYDSYPMFAYDPVERPSKHALWMDRARAWSGNFIIPEMQSGPGGQGDYFHDHPEPGELRKMTYAAIARGADALQYFRWRTCRFGAEEYWCGILDHDDIPRRRYEEVVQVGAELKRVGPAILGTHVRVDVGIAGADAVVSAAHEALSLGLPSPESTQAVLHKAIYEAGLAGGVVHPADDLSDVKWFFLPHWEVFDPAWVPKLENYVKNGGLLIVGARTATRNLDNNVVAETVPGCLRGLSGITVEEYGKQNAPEVRPLPLKIGKKSVPTSHWYEVLKRDSGTKALATWASRHIAGESAISFRKLGRGGVVYVGTYFTSGLIESLLPELQKISAVQPLWPKVPSTVEVVCRQNAKRRVWFFLNHSGSPANLPTLPSGTELLSGKKTPASACLAAREVFIIQETRSSR